jgi:hypothetical protein
MGVEAATGVVLGGVTVGTGLGDTAINGAGVETAAGVVRATGVDVGMAEIAGFGVEAATGVVFGGVTVGTGLGDTALNGVGVETTAGVVRAIGVDVGLAETAGFGVGTGPALVGAAVVVVVGVEVLEGRGGITTVFEGASGGGVDSAFIFARARSAAGRSASEAQLFSTVASVRFSFILCGRFIPWSVVRAGADITRTSPRTVAGAVVSEFTCRSRRYLSMGCRLRERTSS